MPIPIQRDPTNEEWDKLHELKDEFYERFGALIADLIKKLPTPEIEDHLMEMMQESASVYGSCYDRHLGRHAGRVRNVMVKFFKEKDPDA